MNIHAKYEGRTVENIVAGVNRVIGDGPRDLQTAPISVPEDLHAVAGQSRRGKFLRSVDGYGEDDCEEFEESLAERVGAKYVVAVSSGTAALHLALLACGVEPGGMVIIPSLTFAATAFAVRYCGARPIFIDSRSNDGNIDSMKVDVTAVDAVVCVHLLGSPCDTDKLVEIAHRRDVPLIEDAAQALGSSKLKGDVAVFSFNMNKIVTTFGGGALATNSRNIANLARHLATQAKVPHPYLWQHDQVGFNYRMPPICAALGASQMRRFDETLAKKRELYEAYWREFNDCMIHCEGNHWINAIRVHPDLRNPVIEALQDEGFGARALFTPLHMLPIFDDCHRDTTGNMPISERLHSSVVCLPSSIRP